MSTDPDNVPHEETWRQLLTQLIRLAKMQREDRSKLTSSERKMLAVVRRGGNKATEHIAYQYVLPYLPHRSNKKEDLQQIALLRVCAIIADFPKVPQIEDGTYRSFGHWARLVGLARDRDQGVVQSAQDMIGDRLAYLHTHPLEEAVASIRRVFQLANGIKGPIPAIDYNLLAKTLMGWGNGISARSRNTRMRVIQDFYINTKTEELSSTPDQEN